MVQNLHRLLSNQIVILLRIIDMQYVKLNSFSLLLIFTLIACGASNDLAESNAAEATTCASPKTFTFLAQGLTIDSDWVARDVTYPEGSNVSITINVANSVLFEGSYNAAQTITDAIAERKATDYSIESSILMHTTNDYYAPVSLTGSLTQKQNSACVRKIATTTRAISVENTPVNITEHNYVPCGASDVLTSTLTSRSLTQAFLTDLEAQKLFWKQPDNRTVQTISDSELPLRFVNASINNPADVTDTQFSTETLMAEPMQYQSTTEQPSGDGIQSAGDAEPTNIKMGSQIVYLQRTQNNNHFQAVANMLVRADTCGALADADYVLPFFSAAFSNMMSNFHRDICSVLWCD